MNDNSENYDKLRKSSHIRGIISKIVIYTLLTFWALMVLFPFYWMVLTSIKSYSSYNT